MHSNVPAKHYICPMIFIFRRRRRKRKPLTAAQAEEVERLRAQAKAALPPRLAELAALHGFTYNSVRIKHNVSNWGSCSELGFLFFRFFYRHKHPTLHNSKKEGITYEQWY